MRPAGRPCAPPGHVRAALQCALVLLLGIQSAAAEIDEFAEPSRVVEGLHNGLVQVMQNSAGLGYAGRYAELEPVIRAGFDTPLIVKVILSRYWNEMNDGQREEFVELFTRLSIATYASRFDNFGGEQFVQVAVEKLKRDRLLVKTELRRPNGAPIKLDYLMHQVEQGPWMIISVIANGVNDLSLKRAEYAAVLKGKGYESLVHDIETKITDMAAGSVGGDDVVPAN